MKLIFVAGIHGVGKTTACQEATRTLQIQHHTASQLIREEEATAIACDSKRVADLDGNQQLLIQAVRRVTTAHGPILLDGHFTLRNQSGEIGVIDVLVFAQMKMAGIVVYRDEAVEIAKRINQRDGSDHSVKDIDDHQTRELAHAQLVSSSLAIPLLELKAFDHSGLIGACNSWLV